MTTFTAVFLITLIVAFYGLALAILVAAAIGMWLMVLDDMRERRLRKRLEMERER